MPESESKNINPLAHNIRFLRNKMGISQDEMAKRLNIKRSNIAAYEIKNVEPRLRVILEMSDFFDIDIENLIQTRLNDEIYNNLSNTDPNIGKVNQHLIQLDDHQIIEKHAEKTRKLRQIFDGFKAFYNFKRERMKETDPQKQKLLFDIENFLSLMEHLLSHNDDLIKAITSGNRSSS